MDTTGGVRSQYSAFAGAAWQSTGLPGTYFDAAWFLQTADGDDLPCLPGNTMPHPAADGCSPRRACMSLQSSASDTPKPPGLLIGTPRCMASKVRGTFNLIGSWPGRSAGDRPNQIWHSARRIVVINLGDIREAEAHRVTFFFFFPVSSSGLGQLSPPGRDLPEHRKANTEPPSQESPALTPAALIPCRNSQAHGGSGSAFPFDSTSSPEQARLPMYLPT